MSDKFILDEHGEPQGCDDLMQWARWFEESNHTRRVARTVIGDLVVSTVFLALNHRFEDGPPVLWETMVFRDKEGLWFDRCGGSREQAEAMHEAVIAKVKEKISNLNHA